MLGLYHTPYTPVNPSEDGRQSSLALLVPRQTGESSHSAHVSQQHRAQQQEESRK